MKKVLSIFLTMLAFTSIVSANDIAKMPWGMFQNNASHTGYIDTTIDVSAFSFNWRIFVGSAPNQAVYYHSQPVVDGNLVYVRVSNALQAFSIYDGHQIWRNGNEHAILNPPSVVNGIVYIQDWNSSSDNAALFGYDSNTGKNIFESLTTITWSYNSNPTLAPTIFEGQVYVGGGLFGGTYSFNATTGSSNWFSPLLSYDIWTPAVNKQFVITYIGGQLNVLDRLTGKTQVNITDPNYHWNGYFTEFAPVLISDNEVLGIGSGYLSLFNIANQNITWSKGPGYNGQPAYDGKFIYVSRNDGLYVLDTAGKVAWKWYQDNENVLGQILVTKNLVFVSTNKNVYAISKETRELVWTYPASGVLSLGMGHLYILDNLGNLISINVRCCASGA